MGALVGDVVSSVEVEHAVKEIGQSWNRAVESIIETAVLVHKYKKSKLWNDIKEQLISRNIMKDSVMSMLSGIGENSLLTSKENIPLLPPSYNTLYQLTRLGEEELERKLNSGEIHPELTVEEAREWTRSHTTKPRPSYGPESPLIRCATLYMPTDVEFPKEQFELQITNLQKIFPGLVVNFGDTKNRS